jgi:putative tryptophan/tyrosine transport system substrate-binding protein
VSARCRVAFIAVVLLWHQPSLANESRSLPSVGVAVPVDPTTDVPFRKAFADGLRERGYVDGKNITLIVRHSHGDREKYRALIRELIALRVDVLLGEAPALKAETKTIPIVSPVMSDPVRTGLVASLARPGGNVTGLSYQRYEIDPKLLELAKELVPRLRHVCLVFDDSRERDLSTHANSTFRALAADLGVSVCMIPVRSLDDVLAVGNVIEKERPQAVMTWASPFMYQHREALMKSIAYRVPVIGDGRELAEVGAVLSYSVDFLDMFRRSAGYVDRILKGAKPGDLPIEQPTKFQLIVNLRTARALNLKVPESILVRAEEVIR